MGYSKDAKISFNSFKQRGMPGSWGNYTPQPDTGLRWHCGWADVQAIGYDWDAFAEPTKYNDKEASQIYCKNMSSDLFWGAAGNYNSHTNRYHAKDYALHDGYAGAYTTSVALALNTVLADYIMDSKTAGSSAVWSRYQPNAYDIVTETQGKYNSSAINSWWGPTADGCGVASNIVVYCDGKNSSAITKVGRWIEATNTIYSPGLRSQKWYELSLQQYTKDKGKIKNNIDPIILNEFSASGYTGSIESGFPVTFLEKGGVLKFKIDTTPLEKDVYLGFSTLPITQNGTSFEGLAKDAKIKTFTIDGIHVLSGSKLITPGTHKIELQIEGKNIPLFFKLAYPYTDTTTIRKVFTMPKDIEFTMSDD